MWGSMAVDLICDGGRTERDGINIYIVSSQATAK